MAAGPDTIAILMTGDMGHAVGRELVSRGHSVITGLEGRSERTRTLAAVAGIRDAGTVEAAVAEAGMILSILPPASALEQAHRVAAAMTAAGTAPVYVDCNAISPDTARRVGEVIAGAGAPVLDVGIVGPAPGKAAPPRFYVSGADTAPMEALDGKGIQVRPIGAEIGRASGLKMCYAALTKGTWTLQTAILMCAEVLGLSEVLRDEFRFSQADTYAAMEKRLPRLPADSERWIGEMEEIAATFAAAGLPPDFHRGAAEIFRLLAGTPFAAENRESIDPDRTLEESVTVYSRQIKR